MAVSPFHLRKFSVGPKKIKNEKMKNENIQKSCVCGLCVVRVCSPAFLALTTSVNPTSSQRLLSFFSKFKIIQEIVKVACRMLSLSR